ncbi:hypothetical protein [Streptomyces sp. NPDC006477]|uniref:hypothetical protein n=1 Tax=Streptomyces sp. NPDC006477 TaxID=3364747 RepID=UPI00368E06BE
MAATKDEENTKTTSTSTRTTAAKTEAKEPVREDLTGVLRTSRVGKIEWGDSSGSSEDDLRERRYKSLEEAKKPGDEGYNPFTDPLVPTSTMAQTIAAEIRGSMEEGGTVKSPTWDSLHQEAELARDEWTAQKKFQEERAAKRAA